MPSHNYRIYATNHFPSGVSREYIRELQTKSWSLSPRVNGRLQLKSNSFSLRKQQWLTLAAGDLSNWSYGYSAAGSLRAQEASLIDPLLASLYNRAYGRLRGRLYKGNSQLGVTFASWRQSREMIVGRYKQLTSSVERVSRRILRSSSRRARARAVADTHLEIIFGWFPLLADIHNACLTVIQDADRLQFVTARANGSDRSQLLTTVGGKRVYSLVTTDCYVTLSTQIRIANPNRWLLERAGLLNPAAVAWDLVPWSFVVNMFVNVSSLVNTITDFAGLSFPNASTTRKAITRRDRVRSNLTGDPMTGAVTSFEKWQSRSISGITPPSLELKVPGVNWELAAMSASLFTQRFSQLNRLFGSRN